MRVAVVGVGYLGRFHAEKLRAMPGADLIAVVDPDAAARERVAALCGCRPYADHRELLGRVDAVSVVTPTPSHHRIARAFLEAGAHVLVEKPMCATVAEARDLVALAARQGRVLQVGHLERFNPAVVAALSIVGSPKFIESQRLAAFQPRGTDVSVVLDLMIHDIDLIMNVVRAPIVSIDAIGAPVFTPEVDIANARLRFGNGCVADVTASRISLKPERRLRIFQEDCYLSIDLQQKRLVTVRRRPGMPSADALPIDREERVFAPGDALGDEIASFLDVVRRGGRPVVSGEDGLAALETALSIGARVRGEPDAGHG